MNGNSKNPKALVKDRAKEIAGQGDVDVIVTLTSGVRVQLKAVSSSLVEDVKASIPYPDVPRVWIEAKEREEENPNDPVYLAAVERINVQRGDAVLDALCLFGVDLVDGLPEDTTWLRRLKFLAKKGRLNLDGFDFEDDFDLEYLYKRYVAVAGADMHTIAPLYGVRPLEVAQARDTFLGSQTRRGRSRVSAETRGEDGAGTEPADDGVGSGDGSGT